MRGREGGRAEGDRARLHLAKPRPAQAWPAQPPGAPPASWRAWGSVPLCPPPWAERFRSLRRAAQTLLWPVLSAPDFSIFALICCWNTATFLKSSRWELQATPTSPIPAPPCPTLPGSTLFSKKASGAWKFGPSSSPPRIGSTPVYGPRLLGDPGQRAPWCPVVPGRGAAVV